MRISDVKKFDVINGEGIRVSLFVSGCSHKCKGCFNKETWSSSFGEEFTSELEEQIFEYFYKYRKTLRGLSLLGGDPTFKDNVFPLAEFVRRFKERFPEKDVWMWSGYTWDNILKDKGRRELAELCDVIVDGLFVEELKDPKLKFRGSSNQRLINVKESIRCETLVQLSI